MAWTGPGARISSKDRRDMPRKSGNEPRFLGYNFEKKIIQKSN
jgi:hypothetical protein